MYLLLPHPTPLNHALHILSFQVHYRNELISYPLHYCTNFTIEVFLNLLVSEMLMFLFWDCSCSLDFSSRISCPVWLQNVVYSREWRKTFIQLAIDYYQKIIPIWKIHLFLSYYYQCPLPCLNSNALVIALLTTALWMVSASMQSVPKLIFFQEHLHNLLAYPIQEALDWIGMAFTVWEMKQYPYHDRLLTVYTDLISVSAAASAYIQSI